MPEIVWTLIIVFGVFIFAFLVLVVGFGALFGAPFLPTHQPQVKTALKLLNLKKGQTVLELGSGDGRVLVEAAKQGYKAIGVELNPILVIYSWLVTLRWRKQIRIVWGNFWQHPLPEADGIFVFLLKPYMQKIDIKISKESKKPIKLVSYAFYIQDKKPIKTKEGLFLYVYR